MTYLQDTETTFQANGYFTVSNAIGFEIEISSCGEMARVKDGETVSDWQEIETAFDDETNENYCYITHRRFEIDFRQVMRINNQF